MGEAGAFTVRFLLIGENGSINQGIFLGDAQVPGLAAGFNQPLAQTLQLPAACRPGMNLNSVGYARIAVMVDAENTVNEASSATIWENRRPSPSGLPGTNGTSVVPTTAAAGVLPSLKAAAGPQDQAASQAGRGREPNGPPRTRPRSCIANRPRRSPASSTRSPSSQRK